MSADNGIYIAIFPDGSFRVAHAFASVVDELESHYYSPEEYKEGVEHIWGGSDVHMDQEEALVDAQMQLHAEEYTEYGICEINLPVNFGEMKAETPVPGLPEGACPHCSSPGAITVMHGENDSSCRNPELPRNIIAVILRENAPGVSSGYVTRVILEGLDKASLTIVKKEG